MIVERLKQALRDIDTVLRVEGMDLELGSRRLLKESQGAMREAISAIEQQEQSGTPVATPFDTCPTCEALALAVMLDQTGSC